jgi:DNA-3-methyladenine glycosylase II
MKVKDELVPYKSFTSDSLPYFCSLLADVHPVFDSILSNYGLPPCWERPCTFDTLCHIILEQQVSLASARSAYSKLRNAYGELQPDVILSLTDSEFLACSVTRQKRSYMRSLAEHIKSGSVNLEGLHTLSDEEISIYLQRVKGIGNWTTDIILMQVLHRMDRFPLGDIALLNAIKGLHDIPKQTSVEELVPIITKWQPYRTVAAYMLWHWYIQTKGIEVPVY